MCYVRITSVNRTTLLFRVYFKHLSNITVSSLGGLEYMKDDIIKHYFIRLRQILPIILRCIW